MRLSNREKTILVKDQGSVSSLEASISTTPPVTNLETFRVSIKVDPLIDFNYMWIG